MASPFELSRHIRRCWLGCCRCYGISKRKPTKRVSFNRRLAPKKKKGEKSIRMFDRAPFWNWVKNNFLQPLKKIKLFRVFLSKFGEEKNLFQKSRVFVWHGLAIFGHTAKKSVVVVVVAPPARTADCRKRWSSNERKKGSAMLSFFWRRILISLTNLGQII